MVQHEGDFPKRKQDIPSVIVGHIAEQLQIPRNAFDAYALHGRTARRHQHRIRQLLQFRAGTIADAQAALAWLLTHDQLLEEHNFDRLKEMVYERYKERKIQPPQPKRVDRIVRSALHTADGQLYEKVHTQLSLETKEKLDAILNEVAASGKTSLLATLKGEVGAATLDNVLSEIAKLQRIRSLSLPDNVFAGVSRKRLL